MTVFTLQVILDDRTHSTALDVKMESDLWRHVEAAARGLPDPRGARIQVRDAGGGIVVLTGASAALARADAASAVTTNGPLRLPADVPASRRGAA